MKEKISEPLGRFARKIRDAIYAVSCFLHSKVFYVFRRKNGKSSILRQRRNELIFITCVLAFPLAVFCTFYIGVNINSILLAFKEYDYDTLTYRWAGFRQFTDFIDMAKNEPFMLYSLKNSLWLLLVTLGINLPLHILNAHYIYKKKIGSKVFKFLLFLPSMLSSVVLVTIFKYFLDYGLQGVYAIFDAGTPPQLLTDVRYGFRTILAYSVWSGFGGSILLFVGIMNSIPPSIVEAAQIDGITPVKEFFYITLPLIFPTISIFIVTSVAGFFSNQGALFTFFGSGARKEYYTFGYYYFIQVIGEAGVGNYPMAAAAGLLFTAIIAPITLFIRWLFSRLVPAVDF